MEVVTYSLKFDGKYSGGYYTDIGAFTDKVEKKIENELEIIAYDLMSFIIKNNVESLRSKKEYALELLTLGVLLQLYGVKAVALRPFSALMLKSVCKLRESSNTFKPLANRLKGRLSTIYLYTETSHNTAAQSYLARVDKLVNWLAASGEYKYTTARLNNIVKVLSNKDGEQILEVIDKVIDAAEWFKQESKNTLGKYTYNVGRFLKDVGKRYKNREDIIFCSKREVEYHLNMVGAEIMNREFRKMFLETKTKMLFLPGCMRKKSPECCKAVNSKNGYICGQCTEECGINKLTKLGEDNDFKTFIILHESNVFSNAKVKKGEIGIVGVACVLNLLEGGWKARELNFIPQCVILDYCGCQTHWSEKGIETGLCESQLRKILNI